MITQDLIKGIRAASALATKGPWVKYGQVIKSVTDGSYIAQMCCIEPTEEDFSNASFIALVRNHVDEILDRVEELEKLNAAYKLELNACYEELGEDLDE